MFVQETISRILNPFRNEKQKFEIAYGLYADMLYRLSFSYMKNKEDAEDVVSEAVFDMYKGIHKLKDLTAYRAWAMKILNVKCSIKMKEYYINRTEDIEELDCQSLENVESGSVLRADIKKALGILSDEEKTIVLCSAVAGMSSDEISEMINLNSNTIRSKLSRALLKLRNCKCFKYDY